jgi:homoserine acetyltransferase
VINREEIERIEHIESIDLPLANDSNVPTHALMKYSPPQTMHSIHLARVGRTLKALDYFDLSGGKLIPEEATVETRFLVISFKSDWLYPSYQSQDIVRQLKTRHVDATYCELRSTYGHDAFLVELGEMKELIRHFIDKTFNGYEVTSSYDT